MPHFTVTKVEDKVEGAEASASQEEEVGLAEIKTFDLHSNERGESLVESFGELCVCAFQVMVTEIVKL